MLNRYTSPCLAGKMQLQLFLYPTRNSHKVLHSLLLQLCLALQRAACLLGLGLDVGAPGLEPVLGAGRPAAADVGAVAPPATQQTVCHRENIGR